MGSWLCYGCLCGWSYALCIRRSQPSHLGLRELAGGARKRRVPRYQHRRSRLLNPAPHTAMHPVRARRGTTDRLCSWSSTDPLQVFRSLSDGRRSLWVVRHPTPWSLMMSSYPHTMPAWHLILSRAAGSSTICTAPTAQWSTTNESPNPRCWNHESRCA